VPKASLTISTSCAGRRVVRVDLRRLQIGVTEILLDRPQRHAGRGQRGRERVPQVVEADHPHARVLAGRLELARDLHAIERDAEVGVPEHEVLVLAVDRAQPHARSSPVSRSVIGTDRFVLRSDLPLPECS
jgi:hypothetical protein